MESANLTPLARYHTNTPHNWYLPPRRPLHQEQREIKEYDITLQYYFGGKMVLLILVVRLPRPHAEDWFDILSLSFSDKLQFKLIEHGVWGNL